MIDFKTKGGTLRKTTTNSFVERFKIPYNESVEWDQTVGKPEIERLGLCGKTISSRGSEHTRRKESLINLGFLTEQESNFLEDVNQDGFQDSICMKEAGHQGPCSKAPYKPKGVDKTTKGIIQKITDPFNNPGGDPNPLQNRGGSRNGLIQLDNASEKLIRQKNKTIGIRPENKNLGIRLAMGGSKYMMALAYLDMMACIYNVKGAKGLFKFPPAFEKIVQQRWQELKDYYFEKELPIFDDHDNLQDPILSVTVDIDWFGKGHEDLMGIQFGHVDPISEEKWMTRPFNVLPITRKTNLIQSNDSLFNVMLNMYNYVSKHKQRFS